jgi:hypothetical protein
VRPRLLDLYCGLGGAARGYQRAGFYVVGVDIVDQPDYAGDEFHRGSALDFLVEHGHLFVAGHASPPCQGSSAPTKGTNRRRNTATGRRHPLYIPATRALLELSGLPFVIENVVGAELRRDLTLCGLGFGLRVFRHRHFELGGWSMARPAHPSHRGHRVSGWRHGVMHEGDMFATYGAGGGKATVAQCREGLGIDWSQDRQQLIEAIPPAYTEYVGRGLMAHLAGAAAAG